jgi:hypothetical protein
MKKTSELKQQNSKKQKTNVNPFFDFIGSLETQTTSIIHYFDEHQTRRNSEDDENEFEENNESQFLEFLEPHTSARERLSEAILIDNRLIEEHDSIHYYFEEALSYPFKATWKPQTPLQRLEILVDVISATGFDDVRGELLRIKIRKTLESWIEGTEVTVPAYQIFSKGRYSKIVLNDNRFYMKEALLVSYSKLLKIIEDVDILSVPNELDDEGTLNEIKARYSEELKKTTKIIDFRAIGKKGNSYDRTEILYGDISSINKDLLILLKYFELCISFPFEATWKSSIVEKIPTIDIIVTGVKMSSYFGLVFQIQSTTTLIPAEEVTVRNREQDDEYNIIDHVLSDYSIWIASATLVRSSMERAMLGDLSAILQYGGTKSYSY